LLRFFFQERGLFLNVRDYYRQKFVHLLSFQYENVDQSCTLAENYKYRYEIEPATSVSERPQTQELDRAATEIGDLFAYRIQINF